MKYFFGIIWIALAVAFIMFIASFKIGHAETCYPWASPFDTKYNSCGHIDPFYTAAWNYGLTDAHIYPTERPMGWLWWGRDANGVLFKEFANSSEEAVSQLELLFAPSTAAGTIADPVLEFQP